MIKTREKDFYETVKYHHGKQIKRIAGSLPVRTEREEDGPDLDILHLV